MIIAIALATSLPSGIVTAQGSSDVCESIEVQIPITYQ
jgi:hypothetical protein